jgi:hypothetical protein
MIRTALWAVQDGTRSTCPNSLKQKSSLVTYNFPLNHRIITKTSPQMNAEICGSTGNTVTSQLALSEEKFSQQRKTKWKN